MNYYFFTMCRFILLIAFAFLFSTNSVAQSNMEKKFYRYSNVSFDTKGGKYIILLQEGGSKNDPQPMTNQDGFMVQFPNWVDALNYLSLQGWEVVFHSSTEELMKDWVMKKEISKEQLTDIVRDNTIIKQKR